MSGGGPREPSNLIDRYLDGLLSAAERSAFEQRLRADAELRAQVELQSKINASLSRSFAIPDPQRVVDRLRGAPASAAPAPAPRRSIATVLRSRWGALAASLLLVLGVWAAWRATRHVTPDGYDEYPVRYTMEMVYRMETQKGFQPQWICDTERELVTTYWLQLNQPLAVPIPPEKKGWGLSYFNTFSPKTVVLLAKVNDTPVMVFADRAEKDTRELPSQESNLHAHRKQIGDIVLYEVSPLPQPHLLDDFYMPTMPQEWKDEPVRPGMD